MQRICFTVLISQDGCTSVLAEMTSIPVEEVISYPLDLYLQRVEAGQGRNTKKR